LLEEELNELIGRAVKLFVRAPPATAEQSIETPRQKILTTLENQIYSAFSGIKDGQELEQTEANLAELYEKSDQLEKSYRKRAVPPPPDANADVMVR
jgi:hypothetical protein